ncbi:MAG: glycosyltransferase family 4 protein [Patescibacteria group bacterium]|jgi:glycosyltransferase involved in cell wall biosynthesis
MKILNINKYYYIKGGAERYYFALTELLMEHGHQVIPFSQKHDNNMVTAYADYFPETKYRFFSSPAVAAKLEQLIKKEQPDIAHVHLLYHHLTPAVLTVLKRYRIPVVMTVHDYKLICPNYLLFTQGKPCIRCKRYNYYQCVIHRCIKNSYAKSSLVALEMYWHKFWKSYENNINVFIVPSEFVKNKLIEFGLPANKIKQIAHFIDLNNKQPVYQPGEYLLYFGRLSAEKGVDKILEVLYNSALRIKFKIAGNGPYLPVLQKLVKQYSLQNQVEFLGHLDTNQLQQAIQQARLTIVPSMVWETFGLAALESFAYGKTALVSGQGGLAEVVIHNQTGIIYQPSQLAEELNNIWVDEKKIISLGKNARLYVEKNYNKQQHYEKVMSVYHALLRVNS